MRTSPHHECGFELAHRIRVTRTPQLPTLATDQPPRVAGHGSFPRKAPNELPRLRCPTRCRHPTRLRGPTPSRRQRPDHVGCRPQQGSPLGDPTLMSASARMADTPITCDWNTKEGGRARIRTWDRGVMSRKRAHPGRTAYVRSCCCVRVFAGPRVRRRPPVSAPVGVSVGVKTSEGAARPRRRSQWALEPAGLSKAVGDRNRDRTYHLGEVNVRLTGAEIGLRSRTMSSTSILPNSNSFGSVEVPAGGWWRGESGGVTTGFIGRIAALS